MTPDEQQALEVTVKSALEPYTDIIKKIVGPPAEEAGLILRDAVRYGRFHLQAVLFKRLHQKANELDINLSRVPLNRLCPLLEGASLEENESMQERWANLLLNSANAERLREIPPSFPKILSELGSDQAMLLDRMFDELWESQLDARDEQIGPARSYSELAYLYDSRWGRNLNDPGPTEQLVSDFATAVGGLVRAGVILRRSTPRVDRVRAHYGELESSLSTESEFILSRMGAEFVRACRMPEPQAVQIAEGAGS